MTERRRADPRTTDNVRYWPKTDIPRLHRTCPLLGVKRTWPIAGQMSAFDPKRTWAVALHMSAYDPKRTSRNLATTIGYFVIMRVVDGGGPGAAGEITKVSQAFQPSGLFSAANSL
jgi:hypothetical protein